MLRSPQKAFPGGDAGPDRDLPDGRREPAVAEDFVDEGVGDEAAGVADGQGVVGVAEPERRPSDLVDQGPDRRSPALGRQFRPEVGLGRVEAADAAEGVGDDPGLEDPLGARRDVLPVAPPASRRHQLTGRGAAFAGGLEHLDDLPPGEPAPLLRDPEPDPLPAVLTDHGCALDERK